MYIILSQCMAAWSESASFAGNLEFVALHGDCCHTSSGFPGGGGGKQSRELHRGRPHLLLCLQLCILIWVRETEVCEIIMPWYKTTTAIIFIVQACDVGCEW